MITDEQIKMYSLKKSIKAYNDFFGGKIIYTDEIQKAKTIEDLANVFDLYDTHIEMLCQDAQQHLLDFKHSLAVDWMNNKHKESK